MPRRLLKGFSPKTVISRTESLKASVNIPLFSGGANVAESKSFSISTNGMLRELFPILEKYPHYKKEKFKMKIPSFICWTVGMLTIHGVERSTGSGENKKILGKENYFALVEQGEKFTLAGFEISQISSLVRITFSIIKSFSNVSSGTIFIIEKYLSLLDPIYIFL